MDHTEKLRNILREIDAVGMDVDTFEAALIGAGWRPIRVATELPTVPDMGVRARLTEPIEQHTVPAPNGFPNAGTAFRPITDPAELHAVLRGSA